jgi:competence protein ComEC
LAFSALRSFSFYQASHQKRIIVYNVPKLQAIDIVEGLHYNFIGDSALLHNDFNRNFHLQPARIQQRVAPDQQISLQARNIEVHGKHILIIDGEAAMFPQQKTIDLLILSKNPRFYISQLINRDFPKQVVIDGSVPGWKARLWQHDCDSLHIPCYNVQNKGAYILEL